MADTVLRSVDDLPDDWEIAHLARRLRSLLPDLRARHHLDTVALFGSYARNEQRPDSDLDVLVTFSRTPSMFELMHAQDDISDALGMPVDLVMRTGLQSRLARYVLREAIQL